MNTLRTLRNLEYAAERLRSMAELRAAARPDEKTVQSAPDRAQSALPENKRNLQRWEGFWQPACGGPEAGYFGGQRRILETKSGIEWPQYQLL